MGSRYPRGHILEIKCIFGYRTCATPDACLCARMPKDILETYRAAPHVMPTPLRGRSPDHAQVREEQGTAQA